MALMYDSICMPILKLTSAVVERSYPLLVPSGAPLGAQVGIMCLTIHLFLFYQILVQILFLEIHTRAFLLSVLPSVTDSDVHTMGFMPPQPEQCVRHALILLLCRFFQQHT